MTQVGLSKGPLDLSHGGMLPSWSGVEKKGWLLVDPLNSGKITHMAWISGSCYTYIFGQAACCSNFRLRVLHVSGLSTSLISSTCTPSMWREAHIPALLLRTVCPTGRDVEGARISAKFCAKCLFSPPTHSPKFFLRP